MALHFGMEIKMYLDFRLQDELAFALVKLTRRVSCRNRNPVGARQVLYSVDEEVLVLRQDEELAEGARHHVRYLSKISLSSNLLSFFLQRSHVLKCKFMLL